ncbi:putative N-acetylglucosaminylphosphatidylinositol deacetylase [Rosa chinensis]|uniref:N-acetylglucosaminylphosphatidylinositol deacetylase n=1 Tax=Rosa chinensis TaxID=74649 RepID=A0A2P6P8F2_ROSCH|nr:putative N-acetylglucosaminylphosphatidylinositol deacetylase [Rosa chinensis]
MVHTHLPRALFLNDSNNGGSAKTRNVLLVVAHADDESMFFTPTINYLTSRGHNIHILCLSNGDADGKGNTRKEELYQASAILKVPYQHVKILDHPDLQDGFGKLWITIYWQRLLKRKSKFLLASSQRKVEAWELVSTNIFRKYSGPVDIWFFKLYSMQCSNKMLHCLVNQQPRKSFLAMAQHASQWVWFRKLFVAFSSCTYVNTLRKMK